ncbi:MAG: hypothetical protein JXQ80_12995 [Bacteroidales bacterium]|nr:hypothetical protein [Bacteroidales bacterium]
MSSNLIDLSIQHYGNPEAVAVLIADNPQLVTNSVEFELTDDVETLHATSLIIRDEDDLKLKKVLKELDGKIIES